MKISFKNIVPLLVLFTSALNAQVLENDTIKGKVDGSVIKLDGDGKVTVNYGNKIGDDPFYKDSAKIETEVKYNFLDKKATSDFKVKTIKAPRIRIVEPLDKIRKRYVAFGINDFNTIPMAELSYTTLRNREYSAGFDLSHFSQKQDVGAPIKALYGNSTVALYGKKFYDGKTVYGSADYENNVFNFYGYNADQFLSSTKKDFQRGVGKFNLTAGFKSNLKDESKWGYDLNLNYNELSLDHMITVENKVDLNTNINKYMEWKKFDWFKGIFNLNHQVSYLNSERPLSNHKSFLFNLFPSFDLKLKELDLTVGGKVFYQTDNKKLNGMFYLEGDFAFVKDVLHIFGRFQNDYKRLSYLDYVYENPFVANYQEILNVNTPIDFMGGVKGAFSSNSSFSLGFRYRDYKSMPLYYNLSSNPTMEFNIVSDAAINRQGFAEFISEGKKLDLITRAEYNLYDVYKNEAYHLPAFYGETRFSYKMQDKFVIGTDLFLYGKQLALESFNSNGRPSTKTLDAIFDFNIDIKYNYSEKLGAFFKTNNILNTKHVRWDQYANYGFNVLVGVDYNF